MKNNLNRLDNLVRKMNKNNILQLFSNEEYIEISIVEMPYKEYLVELKTFGKTMSVITDDWEVLLEMF